MSELFDTCLNYRSELSLKTNIKAELPGQKRSYPVTTPVN